MYECIDLVFGVVPTEEQLAKIYEEFGDEFPDDLGGRPYSGDCESTEYIGVELGVLDACFEMHGLKVAELTKNVKEKLTEDVRAEAKRRCDSIRKFIPDFPEPELIFTTSTS